MTDTLAEAWDHSVETPTDVDETDAPRTIHCGLGEKSQSARLSQQLTTDSAKVAELPEALRSDDGALTWDRAVDEYDREFAGEFNNNEFTNTKEHRALTRYGRLLHTDRRLRDKYDDLHIGFVTLRGSPFNKSGRWIPPLDYLEALNESSRKVKERFSYEIGKRERSEWCAVLAGSEDNSVPHWHYVFWVDGEIRPTDFSSMLEAHEEHSPVAGQHVVEDAVRVAKVDGERLEGVGSTELPEDARELHALGTEDREHGKVSPVARYVGHQLPHIAGASGKRHELEHGAVCWAYSSGENGNVLRSSRGFGTEETAAGYSFERFADVDELRAARRSWSFEE